MTAKPYVVAPKAMVRDAGGRYLFIRRSPLDRHFSGLWEMPGGKPDPGESLDQCLVRETAEETGLDIRVTRVLGAAEAEIEHLRLAFLMFEAEPVGDGSVRLSEEHDQHRWLTPAEAAGIPLVPAFLPFMRTLAAT